MTHNNILVISSFFLPLENLFLTDLSILVCRVSSDINVSILIFVYMLHSNAHAESLVNTKNSSHELEAAMNEQMSQCESGHKID